MQKLSKPKTVLFGVITGLLIIGVGLGGSILYRTHQPQPILQDTLSPRAQAFIAKQKEDGTSFWNTVEFDTPLASQTALHVKAGELFQSECLTTTTPWSLYVSHQEKIDGTCRWEGKSRQPLARVVIGRRPAPEQLSDDSGFQLRRRSPEKYQETRLNAVQFTNSYVFRTDDELTIFALDQKYLLTIAFTQSLYLDTISDTQIEHFLDQVQWSEK